jgi:molecular chaperone HscB|tara:strand:- start:707 stop:1198 length:492 start_codon:yes stop_codon:yes gene_type:complete
MSPLNLTYFEIFDIEINISINLNELESKYLKLQSNFHPDKFVNASSVEKTMAVRISTHINDGYKTLKDLVSRVDYILKINNYIIDENKTFKNSDFLVEQMELSERINESDNSQYNDIKMEIKNKISQLIIEMKKNLFDKEFDILHQNNSMIKFYKNNINQISV